MRQLKSILRHRYLFKILAIFVVIIAFVVTKNIKKESRYTNETEFTGTVYKIKKNNRKTTLYIVALEKIIIYDYSDLSSNIKLGDTIYVTGKLSRPLNNRVPNGFNYRNYLYNDDIFYIVNAKDIKKITNNTNLIYYLKDKICMRIAKITEGRAYLQIFLLGDSTLLDEEIVASYRENGISHLFAISGMHISLFAGIIIYVLKRSFYNNYFNYGIVISFLIFYALLVGTPPSVIRSLVMYILFAINRLFNLKIKRIDVVCMALIIILLLKPYYLYNSSFIYSYTISTALILCRNKLKRIKNIFLKYLYVSIVSFMVSLPISLYYYYQVNIVSIILNVFFVPLVSIIIFPLSLISFFIPAIGNLLNIFIVVLEYISLFIYKYKIGIISFPKPSVLMVIMYYISILLFLINKKYLFIFLLLLYHKYIIYFDSSFELTIFDVGQGDSLLIKYPYNKGNILIDTGGNTSNGYSILTSSTIPYLKSRGIDKIHYLLISHGDYDHAGEAINLVNNFKVEKVIFNCGEFNDLEKDLIKVLNRKKIPYYSCIKELNIDKNKLYFLQTKEYDNENDNSNVIYTELEGYKFMFMGDAGVEKEKDILDKYNLSNIDVLKVGHHGSRTSSSKPFIAEIEPKYSIISVGKNNRYGHPNKEVLNNLEDSKIYRTDQDGSVMFKIKNNKLKIKTCSP